MGRIRGGRPEAIKYTYIYTYSYLSYSYFIFAHKYFEFYWSVRD